MPPSAGSSAAKEDRRPLTFWVSLTSVGRTRAPATFIIQRKTMGKRMAAKLNEVKATLRLRMHQSPADTIKWLQSLVRGYLQYHAIPGNEVRLRAFRHDVLRLWMRQIRRRSQRSS